MYLRPASIASLTACSSGILVRASTSLMRLQIDSCQNLDFAFFKKGQ